MIINIQYYKSDVLVFTSKAAYKILKNYIKMLNVTRTINYECHCHANISVGFGEVV